MFYNVLNNAVKNTSAGGKVVIKSFADEKSYKVDISDTGKGISPEKMETLFSRFKTRGQGENGTGIGLAIAKSIADFHGIVIRVETIQGQGTTFFFFPVIPRGPG
jgi:signal transduction histidine kinase